MTATNPTEQTALTLPERVAVALGDTANVIKLRELAAQSAGIVTVTNPDGREEAHRAGMVLRTTRTNITNKGKAAREAATAFSKAVIAMEKDLIALIQPEEDRVLALRDKFDEQLAAEKAAKIAAERARTDAIQADIDGIIDLTLGLDGAKPSVIKAALASLDEIVVGEDRFAEFAEAAAKAIENCKGRLAVLLVGAEVAEEIKREAEAARIAEAERLAAERAENARVAAENARIAAEQKAEAQRLADLAAAQQAAALALQREADAQAQAARDEQTKAAAAQQLAFDLQKAEMDAQRRALEQRQAEADARDAAALAATKAAELAEAMKVEAERLREVDHGPVLMMNAEFDVARDAALAVEAERVRLQALTVKAVEDDHEPMPSLDALMDDVEPEAGVFSDDEIIRVNMFQLAMSRDQVIDRLHAIDFDAARAA